MIIVIIFFLNLVSTFLIQVKNMVLFITFVAYFLYLNKSHIFKKIYLFVKISSWNNLKDVLKLTLSFLEI